MMENEEIETRIKELELELNTLKSKSVFSNSKMEYPFNKAIGDSIACGFSIIDENGKQVYVNKAFCDIVGYDESELIGKYPPYIYWPAADMEDVNVGFEQIRDDTDSSNGYELLFCNKEAEQIPVRAYISPFVDEDNTVSWLVNVIDIREQKRNAKKNYELRNRLQSLVHVLQYEATSIQNLLDFTLEEALKLTNSKLGYIYFYDEQKEEFDLFSWSKSTMADCFVQEPNTHRKLAETGMWGEAVRQRRPILVNDFRVPNEKSKGFPQGHASLVNYLTVPVFDGNDIVAVAAVANKESDYDETDLLHLQILMDNTWKVVQKKNMEDLVKTQNEELLKLDENKNRFISILAHDIRNPLFAITSFLDLITQNIRKYDIETLEFELNVINKSAIQLANLTEDILAWSKSHSESLVVEPVEIDFYELSKEVVEELELCAKNKNISIHVLPLNELKIYVDKNKIKTVLRNLISNAIKFTNKNGCILVFAELDSPYAKITISDNGVGVRPVNVEKLFDISHSTASKGTEDEPGTGLGLLICKEFVEKNGGKIWAESQQGKGSDFIFTVPLCPLA